MLSAIDVGDWDLIYMTSFMLPPLLAQPPSCIEQHMWLVVKVLAQAGSWDLSNHLSIATEQELQRQNAGVRNFIDSQGVFEQSEDSRWD